MKIKRQNGQQHSACFPRGIKEELDGCIFPARSAQMPMRKYIGTSTTSRKYRKGKDRGKKVPIMPASSRR